VTGCPADLGVMGAAAGAAADQSWPTPARVKPATSGQADSSTRRKTGAESSSGPTWLTIMDFRPA